MFRTKLKEMAKEQIKGNLPMLFIISLVNYAIVVSLNLFGYGGLIYESMDYGPSVGILFDLGSFIITPPLTLSICIIYLSLINSQKPDFMDIFIGFKSFGKAVLLNFLIFLFTILWTLLFIIPGIIKGISYSQAFYIMAENPEMTPLEAINESKRIMDGYKLEYFVLGLSFILWILLAVATCGIAFVYVAPYMSATYANFYKAVSK